MRRILYVCLTAVVGSAGLIKSQTAQASDKDREFSFSSTSSSAYSSNPNLSKQAVDAAFVVQDLSLTFKQYFNPNLYFQFIPSVSIDRENRAGFSGDAANLDFSFVYKTGGWTHAIGASPNWNYLPTFQDLAGRYSDIYYGSILPKLDMGSAGSLSLRYGYRERVHDTPGASHHSPSTRLSWSKDLTGSAKDWSVGGFIEGRYIHYIDSPTSTRDWMLRERFAIKRNLDKMTSIEFAALHENRFSNVAGRQGENWILGVSLSFDADLLADRR